jgi:MFS family permease
VETAVYERFDNIEDLAWVGLGFPMASVAGILFIGRLYGLFNTKHMLNTSIFVFEVGSALCGAAPNMNALIIGRVIAGLGGCGMYLG